MRMRLARPATTAGTRHAGTRRRAFLSADIGGERGKFLGQFLRTAPGAGRSQPIAGAHEDFVVGSALFTMKFVNGHEKRMCCSRAVVEGSETNGHGFHEFTQIKDFL